MVKENQENEWVSEMSEGEKEVNQQLMDSYNMGTIEQDVKTASPKKSTNERF